jgi:hypothetical protein
MELQFHPAHKLSSNLYNMCQCQMYSGWITPDDGQRNCPKHVGFRTRINLEISASVGFIVKKFIMMHSHMSIKFVWLLSCEPMVSLILSVVSCELQILEGKAVVSDRTINFFTELLVTIVCFKFS